MYKDLVLHETTEQQKYTIGRSEVLQDIHKRRTTEKLPMSIFLTIFTIFIQVEGKVRRQRLWTSTYYYYYLLPSPTYAIAKQ